MGVIWIIWIVVLLIFYHKIFTVHYFNLGSGLLKELIIAAILGLIMASLSLKYWWLTAIIIIIFGLGMAKKTSNNLVLIGCIILVVVIAITGIRFKKTMNEEEEAESQNIDNLSDTYLDDEISKKIDNSNEKDIEDAEYYDSLDDMMDQTFENDKKLEYSLSETYKNEEEGISFMYPNNWKSLDSDEISNYYAASDMENIIVLLAPEDASKLNECFMISKLQENEITMDELLIDDEEFKEIFVTTYGDELSNIETSVIKLDEIPARAVSFDMNDITFQMYYYGINSDLYQISFFGKKDNKYLKSDLGAVMDTYTIIDVEHASPDYILENSDSQYLSRYDLEGLSKNDCILARNELYARHGRKFNSKDIQDYFDTCSWYQGVIEPDDFQESILNDIEIANRDLIISYEKEMGYR